MPESAKPRKTGKRAMPAKPITTAKAWKSGRTATELALPSGNVALVRNPGVEAFFTANIFPNSLIPIVTEALERGAPPSGRVLDDKLKSGNLEVIQDILVAVDNIVKFCVVEPKVHEPPKDEQGEVIPLGHPDRDQDTLYVDEVDLNDKMFIFQWAVGGDADLARFRKELDGSVATLQHGEDVESETQPAVGG